MHLPLPPTPPPAPCPTGCLNPTAHGTPAPGVPHSRVHVLPRGVRVWDVVWPDGGVEVVSAPRLDGWEPSEPLPAQVWRPLPDCDVDSAVDLDVVLERLA